MRFTINSRKHGEITFSRPGSHYIYVDMNGQPGQLGNQICDGGQFRGSTIGYSGDDDAHFEKICRAWWRAYMADRRKYDADYFCCESANG